MTNEQLWEIQRKINENQIKETLALIKLTELLMQRVDALEIRVEELEKQLSKEES